MSQLFIFPPTREIQSACNNEPQAVTDLVRDMIGSISNQQRPPAGFPEPPLPPRRINSSQE